MGKLIDLTGRRFGRWIVVDRALNSKNGAVYWNVVCDCGNTKILNAMVLNHGRSKSCGCFRRDFSAQQSFKHGLTGTVEFNTWARMHLRCSNPKYNKYNRWGGRGITICKRWSEFLPFLEDMGPRPSAKHSIDRIDNDGNYEPSNCRWATQKQQQNNRSNNVRRSA